jgi:uncharacterized protein with GYD domain
MAHYIMLAKFTDQGIKAVADTTKRANAVKELSKKAGCSMKETYWVLGPHDVVAVFDAPNDETMTSLALSIAKLGNVKTETLRAFTAAEMGTILSKMV